MARRKTQPEGFHRNQIACAAEQLFIQNGIAHTTMDDIAKAAGYSKATLYVYFKNKEEIVGALVLDSMKRLYEHITKALSENTDTRKKYDALCAQMVQYHAQYPFYFEIALAKINIDFDRPDSLPVEKETFEVGERVMQKIGEMIREGMQRGDLRADIQIPQTVFVFWASISGLILLSSKKRDYLKTVLQLSQEQFLADGFSTLYQSIERRN